MPLDKSFQWLRTINSSTASTRRKKHSVQNHSPSHQPAETPTQHAVSLQPRHAAVPAAIEVGWGPYTATGKIVMSGWSGSIERLSPERLSLIVGLHQVALQVKYSACKFTLFALTSPVSYCRWKLSSIVGLHWTLSICTLGDLLPCPTTIDAGKPKAAL